MLILAVGIGLNTAVVSLINMVLLRPLHGESKPGQLASVYAYDRTRPDTYRGFSYPAYVDIRDRGQVFAEVAGLTVTMVGLGEGEMTRRGFAFVVTSSTFPLFDVRPAKGRGFLPEEEKPGANRLVTVVSEEYWRRSFGGPSTMIAPAVWLPTGVYDLIAGDTFRQGARRALADRADDSLMLLVRMKPGVSFASAQAPLAALAGQLEQGFPGEHRNLGLKVGAISRTGISTTPRTTATRTRCPDCSRV